MNSILAGLLISISAFIYLKLNNILGAFMFALGLMTIVVFQASLFTGKAGLFAQNKIKMGELCAIWGGNFLGTGLGAMTLPLTPEIVERAQAISISRQQNSTLMNLILGIFCGLLMYIAVTGFQKTGQYLFLIVPVAAFIICGFAHSVADMAYIWFSDSNPLTLIPVTIGNFIGCNLIPVIQKKPLN